MMPYSNIEVVRQQQMMLGIKRKRDEDIEKNQKELTNYITKTMCCFCKNVNNNKNKIKNNGNNNNNNNNNNRNSKGDHISNDNNSNNSENTLIK